MFSPRNSIYALVATCSLAMAACQPAEGPAERAGKQIDNAAEKVGDQVEIGTQGHRSPSRSDLSNHARRVSW